MPLKVNIPRAFLEDALEMKINSLKRANTGEVNTLIKEIREKDISAITTALNTIEETK